MMIAEHTMTIRPLTVEELPGCVPFAQAFHTELQLPGTLIPEVFVRNWTMFLTQYPAVVLSLWHDDQLRGGLGAMIVPDLLDGRLTATEMFWFVTPEARHGLDAWKLVEAFEAWGDAHFVDEYRVAHMLLPGEDPGTVRLAPLYKRKHYRPLEVSWIKRAKGARLSQP